MICVSLYSIITFPLPSHRALQYLLLGWWQLDQTKFNCDCSSTQFLHYIKTFTMRSALFWDSMQQQLVVCHLRIPEKLTSHLHHSGSLKSRKIYHHKIFIPRKIYHHKIFKVLHVGNAQQKKPHLTLSIKSEVPATLRHSYLGSFYLGGGGGQRGNDIRNLSLGAICNFITGTGLP